jgi:hypothetical protein
VKLLKPLKCHKCIGRSTSCGAAAAVSRSANVAHTIAALPASELPATCSCIISEHNYMLSIPSANTTELLLLLFYHATDAMMTYQQVNSRQVSMSHALKDGDVISLITTSATCSSPTATSASKAASASTGASNNGQQQQQQPLGRVHTQVTFILVTLIIDLCHTSYQFESVMHRRCTAILCLQKLHALLSSSSACTSAIMTCQQQTKSCQKLIVHRTNVCGMSTVYQLEHNS